MIQTRVLLAIFLCGYAYSQTESQKYEQIFTTIANMPSSASDRWNSGFIKCDTSVDNTIQVSEFEACFTFPNSSVAVALFNSMDNNNDGSLSIAETQGNLDTDDVDEYKLQLNPSFAGQADGTVPLTGSLFDCEAGTARENGVSCIPCEDGFIAFGTVFETCRACPEHFTSNSRRDRCIPKDKNRQVSPLIDVYGLQESRLDGKVTWDVQSTIAGCDCIDVGECQLERATNDRWCTTLFCGTIGWKVWEFERLGRTYAPCKPDIKPPPPIAEHCLFPRNEFYQLWPPFDLQLPGCLLNMMKLTWNEEEKKFKYPEGVTIKPRQTWDKTGGLFGRADVRQDKFVESGVYKVGQNFAVASYDSWNGIPGTDNFETLMEELKEKVEELYEKNSNTPVTLNGFSMGGFMITHFTQRQLPEWKDKYIHHISVLNSPLQGAFVANAIVMLASDPTYSILRPYVLSLLGLEELQSNTVNGQMTNGLLDLIAENFMDICYFSWVLLDNNPNNNFFTVERPYSRNDKDVVLQGGYNGTRAFLEYFGRQDLWSRVEKALDVRESKELYYAPSDRQSLDSYTGVDTRHTTAVLLDPISSSTDSTTLIGLTVSENGIQLDVGPGDGVVSLSSMRRFKESSGLDNYFTAAAFQNIHSLYAVTTDDVIAATIQDNLINTEETYQIMQANDKCEKATEINREHQCCTDVKKWNCDEYYNKFISLDCCK